MAKSSQPQALPLFEAKADAMNLGLDLNTDRNLAFGQISASSRALRYERGTKQGAGIMTGPGYRQTNTTTFTSGFPFDGCLEATKLKNTLWVKQNTGIQYSHDAITFYDTGVTLTANEEQGFVEGPDGDVFTSNQVDSAVRFAVGILQAAATSSDTTLNVGTAYNFKFIPGTLYCLGNAITYAPTFTADSLTDILTATAHGLSNGQTLEVSNSGGGLPGGLSAVTTYYVISSTTNTFKLSLTSGGSAIDITSNGTGTNSYVNTSDGLLHGISGIPAGGLATSNLVTQSSTPSTLSKKGNILIIIESKLVMMGVIGYENIAYFSATYDLANPEFFYDLDGNGAYYHTFPGNITAGITGSSVAKGYVFLQRGVHRIDGFDPASGGMLTTEITREYGAYNRKCVVDMDGMIAFMGVNRLIPIQLQMSVAGAIPQLNAEFDKPLRPWLLSHDDITNQADAILKWDATNKILKATAAVNGAMQTYIFDQQNPGFLPAENRNIACSCMLLGKSYFGHTNNGKWYEDDIGRTNDAIPITHIISTGQIQYDKGRRYLKGKEFRTEGYATKGTNIEIRIYLTSSPTPSYDQIFLADDYMTSSTGFSLGVKGIGLDLIGNGTNTVKAYPIVIPLTIRSLNGASFRVEWEVNGDGDFFQLNTWYLSATVPRKQPQTYQ